MFASYYEYNNQFSTNSQKLQGFLFTIFLVSYCKIFQGYNYKEPWTHHLIIADKIIHNLIFSLWHFIHYIPWITSLSELIFMMLLYQTIILSFLNDSSWRLCYTLCFYYERISSIIKKVDTTNLHSI